MTDRSADEAAIRDVLARFEEALERSDLETALALCVDDVVFIGSGEGEQAVGREAILEMAMQLSTRAAETDFRVTDATLDIDVLGEIALVTSFGVARLRSPSGVREGPYRLTAVLVRHEGGWKWRAHHGSEPLPW